MKDLRTFWFPAKLPLNHLGMISFLITNISLLLHPLETVSEQNPERLVNCQADAICSWAWTDMCCEQQPGKCARLWASKGKSSKVAELCCLPTLSPFSFIISYPLFEEPELLIVMDYRRENCFVPVSSTYAISFNSNNLSEPGIITSSTKVWARRFSAAVS